MNKTTTLPPLLALLLACGCAHERQRCVPSSAVPTNQLPSTNQQLRIVCEPRYYMGRDWGSGNLTLHANTNELSAFDVKGVVLEVIEPKAYSGMVFTVHHDSVFDPGDPLVGLALSNRYEFRAWPQDIGKFDFRPCSIDRVRKVSDKQ